MKKQTILKMSCYIICMSFINSCATYEQYKNQKYIYESGVENLTILKNRIYINTGVDGKTFPFIFDTGASFTSISDTFLLKDLDKRKFTALGKTIIADGTKYKNKFYTIDDFKTSIITVKNKMVVLNPQKISVCNPSLYRGIIGTDIFWEMNPDMLLILDFDNNLLSITNRQTADSIINLEKYRIIETQFKRNAIFLDINVNGERESFLFDTGFSGSLIMPSGQINMNESFSIKGQFFSTVNSKISGRNDFYSNVPIEISGLKINGDIIVTDSSIPYNLIGMGIIKNFNWIIDYSNKKTYARRNFNDESSTIDEISDNFIDIVEGRLKIIAIKEKYSAYNIGDEIILVDNEPVTNDNICEVMDLLKSNRDWTEFEIVIK